MKFEKLYVWQRSIGFGYEIHRLTLKFPKYEMFVITSQIKRAADSIALNIAEGSSGQSDASFKQFVSYSIRSGLEVASCLHIGKKRGIVKPDDFDSLYAKLEIILKMLYSLRKSIR